MTEPTEKEGEDMGRKRERVFCLVRAAGIFFFILGLAFFTVSAQQIAEEAAEEKEKPEETKAAAELAEGNISIDFKDADVRTVLRILAEKSGVNIVAGEEVEGRITIKLVNVPWQKALDVILRTYGFVYERDENVVRVTTVENLEKEDLITRVFSLNYANAQEVSNVITEMLSKERGKVKFDARMNLLVITDVPANLTKIGRVIEQLDVPTLQVMVEAKIVEITLGKGEDLGINWSALKAVSVGTSDVKAEYERERKYDHKSERKTAWETIDKTADKRTSSGKTTTDSGGTEVYVDVTGAPWTVTLPPQTVSTDTDSRERTPLDKTTSLATSLTKNLTHTDISSYIQTAVLSISDFNLILSALKTRGDFNLVSNPRIVTTNNQKAEIHVGKTVPIPIRIYNKETGTWEVSGWEDKEVGIKLQVTPSINRDGYIGLEVKPEVSKIFDWTGPYNEIPILMIRQTETQVVIKNGDTLVIGGLVKDEKTEGVNKVPLLGDIPFLGWLFKHKTTKTEKIDLVIFLTPTILERE